MEYSNDQDVNKAFLDTKLTKIDGHISLLEKINGLILHSNKQTGEEVLKERAVKTTIQILYDKGFFVKYDNADEALKDYAFIEVNERRRPSSDQRGCTLCTLQVQ